MNVLPDVLSPGLAIVSCGSAVSSASARRRAYYAGSGNAFWPALAEVGFTPRQLAPVEYQSITKFGLGLTDLAKTISGSDRVLADKYFDRSGLRVKILRFRPRVLVFTSKRAAEVFPKHSVEYGLLSDVILGRPRSSYYQRLLAQHGATGTRDPGVSSRIYVATPNHRLLRTSRGGHCRSPLAEV
jgi:TDG/mug DNA glycosylase family protein